MSTERFITFYQTFDRVVKNIKRIAMPVMQSYGLRSVHTTVFLALRNCPQGLTVTELARECFIDKALSSRIIKELLANDYIVATSEGGEKNYNKKYVLTATSRKILAELNCRITEFVGEAGQNISHEDLIGFYRVLAELDANIDTISKSQSN